MDSLVFLLYFLKFQKRNYSIYAKIFFCYQLTVRMCQWFHLYLCSKCWIKFIVVNSSMRHTHNFLKRELVNSLETNRRERITARQNQKQLIEYENVLMKRCVCTVRMVNYIVYISMLRDVRIWTSTVYNTFEKFVFCVCYCWCCDSQYFTKSFRVCYYVEPLHA